MKTDRLLNGEMGMKTGDLHTEYTSSIKIIKIPHLKNKKKKLEGVMLNSCTNSQ